jgi:hypothetical protein
MAPAAGSNPQHLATDPNLGIVNAPGFVRKWAIVWIVRTTIPLLSGLRIYTGE